MNQEGNLIVNYLPASYREAELYVSTLPPLARLDILVGAICPIWKFN
jgi:hypothetical protein